MNSVIVTIAEVIATAMRKGGEPLIAGSGGSAAVAQHIAGESLSQLNFDRNPLPAITLSTETSVLTAIANDCGFESLFERQIRGLGRRGDVLLVISTPGSSPNIIMALKPRAKSKLRRSDLPATVSER